MYLFCPTFSSRGLSIKDDPFYYFKQNKQLSSSGLSELNENEDIKNNRSMNQSKNKYQQMPHKRNQTDS